MSAPTTGKDYQACSSEAGNPRCTVHGGYLLDTNSCQTVKVLDDVRAERARQFARYGTNEDIEDGTGPGVEWIGNIRDKYGDLFDASDLQVHFRDAYEKHEKEHGKPTWLHLVLEEVAEAFQEASPTRLREELVQVAGLAVSWIEKIDARTPEWVDVDAPQVGDSATHVDGHLDPRRVAIVHEDKIWLDLMGTEHGPLPIDQYTYRRRVF